MTLVLKAYSTWQFGSGGGVRVVSSLMKTAVPGVISRKDWIFQGFFTVFKQILCFSFRNFSYSCFFLFLYSLLVSHICNLFLHSSSSCILMQAVKVNKWYLFFVHYHSYLCWNAAVRTKLVLLVLRNWIEKILIPLSISGDQNSKRVAVLWPNVLGCFKWKKNKKEKPQLQLGFDPASFQSAFRLSGHNW